MLITTTTVQPSDIFRLERSKEKKKKERKNKKKEGKEKQSHAHKYIGNYLSLLRADR